MFREYAIEPNAISSWDKFKFLASVLGWDQGRLIAELPNKWKLKVFQTIKCREVEKKRVELIMQGWDLVRRKDRISNFPAWQDNALAEHRRINFEKIIVEKDPQISCAIPIDDLEKGHFHEPRQIVNRNAAEMALAVRLLLQTGEIIKLVDPHFDLTSPRFRNPFSQFVKTITASPYQRNFSHIEIYTGAGDQNRAGIFAKNIARTITTDVPTSIKIKIYIMDINVMHNRFIMSNKAGVLWNTGLDEQGNSAMPTDDISIMSLMQYKTHFTEYSNSQADKHWAVQLINF